MLYSSEKYICKKEFHTSIVVLTVVSDLFEIFLIHLQHLKIFPAGLLLPYHPIIR